MSTPTVRPTDLPIEPILPALLAALEASRNAVLQAPPGAGKTTRVPLVLLAAPWLAGRQVIVLEPRRLAARAAARRMATMLGEGVGETVGYRVRLDSRVGPATRIVVVTDGIFTRMIQHDPSLAGVGAVLFDEIHERSLEVDLGLALALEAQGALRDDLRLLAMSATLDGVALARLLGNAPVISSEGRAFPVATRYLGGPAPAQAGRNAIADAAAAAIRRALEDESGDVLAFLPGAREIRRARQRLEDAGLPEEVEIHVLHGDLPAAAQDAAIRPAPPGRRKVVLATTIAETSLTIEGIGVVVDAGYARAPRFDPASGMSRLATVRVSQAASEQRRGRAGRLGPGICYRLWSEAEQRALIPQTRPEILEADLAPLALELACWGAGDAGALAWLDPPPAAALAQARDLLHRLGGLAAGGAITPHGRRMAGFGLHPRLAHMVIRGAELGHGRLACRIAALLEERDILRPEPGVGGPRDADLRLRLDLLAHEGNLAGTVDRAALRRVLQMAGQWERRVTREVSAPASDATAGADTAGLLLALAYPDRIGQRRAGGNGQFLLGNGRGAALPAEDALAVADYLVAAELDGDRREARIFLAAPVARADLETVFADSIETTDFVAWDRRAQAVAARRQRRLGALVLDDEALDRPDPEAIRSALLDFIRAEGLPVLPWNKASDSLRARVAFLRRVEGEAAGWPDLSDAGLLARLADWLGPHLDGMTRRAQLRGLDLAAALEAQLDWAQKRRLDEGAPTHLAVPTGSRLALDYASGESPVLAVRLQEMFGCRATPTVAWGRVPVLLQLLSPAGRPVQVTRDLVSFWADGYRAVRADLRGRYPKHFWPEDPLTAPPTRRTRRPQE
jgi:ATP-dependent helicase HrpB